MSIILKAGDTVVFLVDWQINYGGYKKGEKAILRHIPTTEIDDEDNEYETTFLGIPLKDSNDDGWDITNLYRRGWIKKVRTKKLKIKLP